MSLHSLSEKAAINQKLYVCFLALLFAISFAIPLLFAFTVGGIVTRYSFNEADSGGKVISAAEEESGEKDIFFPNSFGVSGPNAHIEVESREWLEPQKDKDLLFSFWIKPRKLPGPGEKDVIISKFDERSASRRGYAFALAGEGESIRPEIYWRDDNNGTWLTFSDVRLEPKTWTLFYISFRQNKFLGLHSASVPEEKINNLSSVEIRLHGGYELPETILPSAGANLLIGAHAAGRFRGKVGPVGIFSLSELTDDIDIDMRDLLVNPRVVPKRIEDSEVMLWLPEVGSDLSNKSNEVKFVKSRRDERD